MSEASEYAFSSHNAASDASAEAIAAAFATGHAAAETFQVVQNMQLLMP